jgi:quercetin dioxygenase-like cupin family protein
VVSEAPLERTEHGLVPGGDSWYVLNADEARWWDRGGLAKEMCMSGKADFSQLGVSLYVLEPREPMAMYQWETDQEDFLVLSGEALLVVEGEERSLRQWDLVHCPAGTKHVIVGAGEAPSVVFAVGARENQTFRTPEGTLEGRDDWGAYTVDEAAIRHGAGVEEETTDADVAYSRFREGVPTRYDGWLPAG